MDVGAVGAGRSVLSLVPNPVEAEEGLVEERRGVVAVPFNDNIDIDES